MKTEKDLIAELKVRYARKRGAQLRRRIALVAQSCLFAALAGTGCKDTKVSVDAQGGDKAKQVVFETGTLPITFVDQPLDDEGTPGQHTTGNTWRIAYSADTTMAKVAKVEFKLTGYGPAETNGTKSVIDFEPIKGFKADAPSEVALAPASANGFSQGELEIKVTPKKGVIDARANCVVDAVVTVTANGVIQPPIRFSRFILLVFQK